MRLIGISRPVKLFVEVLETRWVPGTLPWPIDTVEITGIQATYGEFHVLGGVHFHSGG